MSLGSFIVYINSIQKDQWTVWGIVVNLLLLISMGKHEIFWSFLDSYNLKCTCLRFAMLNWTQKGKVRPFGCSTESRYVVVLKSMVCDGFLGKGYWNLWARQRQNTLNKDKQLKPDATKEIRLMVHFNSAKFGKRSFADRPVGNCAGG